MHEGSAPQQRIIRVSCTSRIALKNIYLYTYVTYIVYHHLLLVFVCTHNLSIFSVLLLALILFIYLFYCYLYTYIIRLVCRAYT